MFFLSKLNIHIAYHMVSQVITYVQTLNLTVLAQLLKQILIKSLKMLLDLAGVDRVTLGVDARGDHVRPLVHVGEKDSRADAGLGVETRAAIPMTARAYLEIEGAVHSVLFSPKYRRQMLRHFSSSSSTSSIFFFSLLSSRLTLLFLLYLLQL